MSEDIEQTAENIKPKKKPNPQQYLKQAENYLQQKDWQQIINALESTLDYCWSKLIENQPETATAEDYVNLGEKLQAENKLEQALNYYNKAIELDNSCAKAYKNLAEILGHQKKWQQAVNYYRQYIAIEKQQLETKSSKTLPSLTAKLKELSQTEKSLTEEYIHQGNQLREQGKIQAAIDAYSQALEVEPKLPEIQANIGSLYALKKQWDKAILAYQKAIELDPNFAGVYRNLARIFNQTGQAEAATDAWFHALKLEPNWASATEHLKLGNTMWEMKKTQQAIKCYRQAIQLQPDLIAAYFSLGEIFKELGKIPQAIRIYRQAIEQAPNNSEAHFLLGQVLTQNKQWDEGIVAWKKTIKLDPNHWLAYSNIGSAFVEQQQWKQAIIYCQHSLELNPNFSWSYHNLGVALLRLDRFEKAATNLQKAIELKPDFAWSYVHLGNALVELKKSNEAITAFLTAIQLQEDLSGIYNLFGYAIRKNCQQQLDNCVEYYYESMPLPPAKRNSPYYEYLADNLVKYKQYVGGILFYRLALKLNPDNFSVIEEKLVQAQNNQKQLNQQIRNLRNKIADNPNLAWHYIQLGNLIADQGEVAEAIILHRQACVLQGWELAASNNYKFRYNWFTRHLPLWRKYLQPLANLPDFQVLEIGSYEGMSTCWLLDEILTHPSAKITCIDLFFQHYFLFNIAATGAENKVIKLLGDSHQLLTSLFDNTYDLIYIDGCHLASYVEKDAQLSWTLLKPNGFMLFDDYKLNESQDSQQAAKIGIDRFLDSISGQFDLLHKDEQVIIKKLPV